MFIYFNENPLNKNVGDCVIRAISKALEQSWGKTYIDLCVKGFILADLPSSNAVWSAYLQENGFTRYIIPNTCSNCYTIKDFADDNKIGTFVVATGTHAVCVQDGIIYDSWHSENEIPIYFFVKRNDL